MLDNHADRFHRTEILLGKQGLEKLQTKSVTVVGLGAVGGYVTEGLVRAGVMNLRLVDFDTFEVSNLNRQILALECTLGRQKAEVARERVLAINSKCRVEAMLEFATADTLEKILSPAPDLLIDAIDSLNPKTDLLQEAFLQKIPTISSMGAALRTDPTLIQTADLFDTYNCPLAKHLRRRLRRRGVSKGIRCVYSSEKVDFEFDSPPQLENDNNSPGDSRGRSRNILGSLPTITGIFGLTIANEAIMTLSKFSK